MRGASGPMAALREGGIFPNPASVYPTYSSAVIPQESASACRCWWHRLISACNMRGRWRVRVLLAFDTRSSARRWCVLLYEPLPLQLGPEIRRNRRLHRGYVGEDLLFAPCTDDQSRGDVRGSGETECRGSKVYTVLGGHRAQLLSLFDEFAWDVPGSLSVVVTRTAGDESRVQRRADHEFDVTLSRHGKDAVERVGMVDQRVLGCEQTYVGVRLLHDPEDRFGRVHTDAPALDDPLRLHAGQGRECTLERDLELLLPRSWQQLVVG